MARARKQLPTGSKARPGLCYFFSKEIKIKVKLELSKRMVNSWAKRVTGG